MGFSNEQINTIKERIEDLIKTSGKTLKEISAEIKETQNTSISPASLGKYYYNDAPADYDKNRPIKDVENDKTLDDETKKHWKTYHLTQSMSIENLVAISQYFNVSIDYLLGLSDSSSTDPDYQSISRILHLGDPAIKNLSSLKDSKAYKTSPILILNGILSSRHFRKVIENIAKLDILAYKAESSDLLDSNNKSLNAHRKIDRRDRDIATRRYEAELEFRGILDEIITLETEGHIIPSPIDLNWLSESEKKALKSMMKSSQIATPPKYQPN